MHSSRIAFFTLALACPMPAFAQTGASAAASPSQVPSVADSLTGPAKTSFLAGQMLVNNHDFEGGIAKLGQAYDLSGDPRLLFDMALCARDLHDYARMQTLLRRYLHDWDTHIKPEERAQVEAALSAIRSLVGGVRLIVDIAGAQVSIDDKAVGTTPLSDRIVENIGKHRLVVTKAGAEPFEQVFEVTGGDLDLNVTLVKALPAAKPAHLRVISDDAATIAVDRKDASRGRLERTLAPGTHEVTVSESGKIGYRALVDMHEGEGRLIEVTLEDEAHGAPWWPWAVGGAAVAAGLVVGGYFLFHTSETQAAGPSATLGLVHLGAWRLP